MGLLLFLSVTVFHGVAVFDGHKLLPPTTVVVDGDRIVRIGPGDDPPGATIIEGRGKTLLPGLIDAHAHPFGAALKQALLFGVTTELDMLGMPQAATETKKRASPDEADLRTAGYAVTAPGGHGTEYG